MVCNVDCLHYLASSVEVIKRRKVVVHTCNPNAGAASQGDLKFEVSLNYIV